MSLPVSTKWDRIDYSFRAEDGSDGYTEGSRLFSDAEFHITGEAFIQFPNVVIDDGFVYVNALAAERTSAVEEVSSVVISSEISGGIPENYTLEFDIYLQDSALPKSFNDVDNRLYVGAINAQGSSAGFLFSYDGIALATHPKDPAPSMLAGGKDLLFNSDGSVNPAGVFIRAVVNGEDNRVYVYAASSDQAYLPESPEQTEAELMWSLAAREAPAQYSDSVIFHASAKSAAQQLFDNPSMGAAEGQDSAFALGSFRLAGYKALPVARPTAVAQAPLQLVVGEATKLNGMSSYDPNGKQLTYNWEFDLKPEGSNARMQGAAFSSTTLTRTEDDGSVVELVTITFVDPTSKYNNYRTEVTRGEPNSLLSMALDHELGVLTIVLGCDSDGEPNVTGSELITGFYNSKAAGYNTLVSGGDITEVDRTDANNAKVVVTSYPRVLSAALTVPSSSGLDLLQEGTFSFSGGAGSRLARPVFIPDKVGSYIMSLRVDNGERKSDPSKVALSVTITEQLLGHRPNSEYMFKYLPDFWNMVKDKDHLTAVWSAMTQVVSSELMSLWQNDYAKALKDTVRKYQRRWMQTPVHEYWPVEELPTVTYFEPATLSNLVVAEPSEGTHSATAIVAQADASLLEDATVELPMSVGKALVYSDLGPPEVVEITSVTDLEDGTYEITAASASFAVYRLIDDRTGGYFIRDLEDITPTTPLVSTVMYDPTYMLNRIDPVKDRVRLYGADGTESVVKVTDFEVGGVENSIRLDIETAYGVDGVAQSWEHLRLAQYTTLVQTPYITLPDYRTLKQEYVLGDYLTVVVTDPYTSADLEVSLSILAVDGQDIFVNWAGLIDGLNASATLNGDHRVWDESSLVGEVAWRLKCFTMHNRTHAQKDLVSIPVLGTDTVKNIGVYKESLDYSVNNNRVEFAPLMRGTANLSEGAALLIQPNFSTHPVVTPYCDTKSILDIEGLRNAGVSCVVLENGPAGVYPILGFDESTGALLIDAPYSDLVEDLRFYVPRMAAPYPGPEHFWAEISYYDNSETVENNFGLFVGFPKSLVDEYDPTLDYLSVIKSMWFAFMSGPHFENMQLAVQAMFNLPFTEQAGRVLYALEATSEREGRIIFMNEDNRQEVHVLPAGTKLATNPRTGDKIAGFPVVSDEALLTEEQKQQLENSKLDAFVKLVDVVTIEDYISNEELINKQFGGNVRQFVTDDGVVHEVDLSPTIIEKYHTFMVNVPLEVTNSTAVFPLVKQFLTDIKPAYTNFILVGSLNFVDEVSVLEEAILHPTILLRDTPHTSPFFARYDGDGKAYTAILPVLDGTGAHALDAETGLPAYSEQSIQQAIVTAERQAKLWPTHKTLEKVAVVDDTALTDEFKYQVQVRIGRGPDSMLSDMEPYTAYADTAWEQTWWQTTALAKAEDPTLAGMTLGEAGIADRVNSFWKGSHYDLVLTLTKNEVPHEYTTDLDTPVLGYRTVDNSSGVPVVSWTLSEMFANFIGVGGSYVQGEPYEFWDPIFAVRRKDTPHFLFFRQSGGMYVLDHINAVVDGDVTTTEIIGFQTPITMGMDDYDGTALEEGESSGWSDLPQWYQFGEGSYSLCDVYFHGDYNGDGIHDRWRLLEDGTSSGSLKSIADIPRPEVSYWDMNDVFEKYEAGYCEGVLDDYSGDGSWNKAHKSLDMVNTWNSDLDVVRSKVWAPVLKQISDDESPEFVLGEPISIAYQGAAVADHVWNQAPPVVDHIGSGVHPKIPYGVVSPQNAHLNTYLLLGFEATYDFTLEALSLKSDESEDLLVNNYADETRLDWYNHLYECLVAAGTISDGDVIDPADITFEGLDSGAVASFDVSGIAGFDKFSPTDDTTKKYFLLETIWQQDKLIEYGPVSDPDFIVTKYIPLGGMTIADYQASSYCFNPSGGISDDPSVPPAFQPLMPFTDKEYPHWAYGDEDDDGALDLDHHTRTRISETQATYYNLEAQSHVPDLSVPFEQQFSPSFSPGFYTWWNASAPTAVDGTDSGIVPASEVLPLLVWGYADQGKLSAANTVSSSSWEPPAGATALQNVHIGMRIKSRKTTHLTHGFTQFYIPPPTIKMIVPSSSGYDVRVCGFYFCNDDPTRVELPTESSHDGTIGGSWVFLRNSSTGEEFPVTDWVFEQGIHVGRHIVPKGPLNNGLTTWVLGREADPAVEFDNGQPSDGHIIEFNIPTLSEEGYYDVIVRNYRPWFMGADTSEGKRSVHIDTVIAKRAYYYSTEGFGGTAWGTSPWGSTE